MEATATDVSHVAELYTLIAVDRCWLPEVFVIQADEGRRNERESSPQSIPMVKQAHLSGNEPSVPRKASHYAGRLTACIFSTPLVWKSWQELESRKGRLKVSEAPNSGEHMWFGRAVHQITLTRIGADQTQPKPQVHSRLDKPV